MTIINKIVLVEFPYIEDDSLSKLRPVLVLSRARGPYNLLVVAYITSNLTEVLDTDILLEQKDPDFTQTGIKYSSLIRLHKLVTVPLESLKGELGVFPERFRGELDTKLKNLFQIK